MKKSDLIAALAEKELEESKIKKVAPSTDTPSDKEENQ